MFLKLYAKFCSLEPKYNISKKKKKKKKKKEKSKIDIVLRNKILKERRRENILTQEIERPPSS